MPGISARLFVRSSFLAIALLSPAFSQALDAPKSDTPKPWEPTDPTARKTYQTALDVLKLGKREEAMEGLRRAARQDGHCIDCLRQAYSLATRIARYRDAEAIAQEWLLIATTDRERAGVHYRIALAQQQQGLQNKRHKYFEESCREFKTALQLDPELTEVHYEMGVSLANLHRDDAARAELSTFLASDTTMPDTHERARRFLKRIDLARARMVPPVSVTTLDGRHISLDGLAGKVVLIDFWAIWCAPCVEALPQIREMVHRFEGQPFVMLSISLDPDEDKWKEFVAKNKMTWPQYRDGSFNGSIARSFGITAIPATFIIDADGVLEEQHIGESANIEGKLKKLIATANAVAIREPLEHRFPDRPAEEFR